MTPRLTRSDFERPRTQAELRKWVDDLHRRFGQTKEGKRAVRLEQGNLVKRFIEEIWPLALFADAFYKGSPDVLFKPAVGNQSYDALLIDASTHRALHHLQITQSFDGYRNYLQMLHLEEYGRAPVTGPLLKEDKASGRVPETWPEAIPHDKVLARLSRPSTGQYGVSPKCATKQIRPSLLSSKTTTFTPTAIGEPWMNLLAQHLL